MVHAGALMPLRHDLERARDKALTSLRDAHDYFAHTKDAWRVLQQDVLREGRRLKWTNTSTKSTVSEMEILSRAQHYVEVELAASSLQQFVSIFENFFLEVGRAWIIAFPERVSSRQLSGRLVIRLPDKAAMIDALIEKELQEVFYDRPMNWFEYMRTLTKISSPTDAEAAQFAEVKATRDVFVHGQGIANAFYVDKAGTIARAQPGKPLDIPGPYHQGSWDLICKLVCDIGDEMALKV
jgi:hypothetical protein